MATGNRLRAFLDWVLTRILQLLRALLQRRRPARRGGWVLAPVNPDFLAYRAAAAAGETVPEVMPSANAPHLVAEAANHVVPPPPKPPQVDGLCDLPASYDRRTLGKVTPAWTTGKGCGACWTSSSLASLESSFAPAELRDFSEAHMQLKWGYPNAKCGEGGNPEIAAFYLAAWRGPVDESDFDPNLPSAPAPPVVKHVQNVGFPPNRKGPTDNCFIKLFVQNVGGVYSGISKSYGFHPTYPTYYNPVAGVVHSVTIVGWDDKFDRNKFLCNDPSLPEQQQVPPADGAWIVKDNGGPTEGEQGFLYVSYYDASIGTMMAVYPGEPLGNYLRNYQYDTLGVTRTLVVPGQKKEFSYQGNVFTATDDELLAAVGFYEMSDPEMDYEIQVHLDPDNGPTNSSGPYATTSISLLVRGYYTLKLPQQVGLAKGQRFGIVLKGHHRDDDWPSSIGIEAPDSWTGSAVTAKAGQSFVSVDGVTWQDLTTLEVSVYPGVKKILTNTNLCIKAFTKGPVYLDAGLGPYEEIKWVVSNDAPTSIRVQPVARRFRRARDGFERLDDVVATSYEDARGTRHALDGGWLEAPAHATVTAFSERGAKADADWITFNAYLFDRASDQVVIADVWKYALALLDHAPAVTSTDPAEGGHVDAPGLSALLVTFDRPVEPGPLSGWISVTSPSETKVTMPLVNGNELKIVLATPLASQELGGTPWKVSIPATAVLDATLGQPLAHDYSWTFTVAGAN
jgi:C1A family cysteine protease